MEHKQLNCELRKDERLHLRQTFQEVSKSGRLKCISSAAFCRDKLTDFRCCLNQQKHQKHFTAKNTHSIPLCFSTDVSHVFYTKSKKRFWTEKCPNFYFFSFFIFLFSTSPTSAVFFYLANTTLPGPTAARPLFLPVGALLRPFQRLVIFFRQTEADSLQKEKSQSKRQKQSFLKNETNQKATKMLKQEKNTKSTLMNNPPKPIKPTGKNNL